MAFGLFIGLACLALGATFAFYVASESKHDLFAYFGWGFMFVGLLVLVPSHGTFVTRTTEWDFQFSG